MGLEEDGKSTALAKRDETALADLTHLSIESIMTLSEAFVESGMFADVKSRAQAMVKVVAGQELGLTPIYSMMNFHLITTTNHQTGEKRTSLAMAAEAMGLLLKRTGKYDYEVIKHDDEECVIEFSAYFLPTREWKMVYTSRFTVQDAEKAGLLRKGGTWDKFRRAMLFSRALSQGIRVVAPDAMGGAKYTIEEAESITPDTLAPVEPAPEPQEKKRRGKGRTVAAQVTVPIADIIECEPSAEAEPGEAEEAGVAGVADPDGLFIEKAPETTTDEAPATAPPPLVTFAFKRDPETCKELSETFKALHEDYGKQPAEVLKDLGVKRNMDITITPSEVYITVATIEESRKQAPEANA